MFPIRMYARPTANICYFPRYGISKVSHGQMTVSNGQSDFKVNLDHL